MVFWATFFFVRVVFILGRVWVFVLLGLFLFILFLFFVVVGTCLSLSFFRFGFGRFRRLLFVGSFFLSLDGSFSFLGV